MLVNIEILASNRRLGEKGEKRKLELAQAEKFARIGYLKIIEESTEDGNANKRANTRSSRLKNRKNSD